MANRSRRDFLLASSALTLAAQMPASLFSQSAASPKRILVGSDTPNGILSFGWDSKTGVLTPQEIAGVIPQSTWIDLSPDRRFLYVACELNEFEGKPTGSVASFKMPAPGSGGKLTLLSNMSAHGKGTCQLTTDHTGHIIICANYAGGTAASFLSTNGKLSEAVWTETYQGYPGHGPVADRQEMAHAHFACISPDNRFVFINDLGSDKIHIYRLNVSTGKLTPAGTFHSHPGAGPRTLHFHRNGRIAYCVNELTKSVYVLAWHEQEPNFTIEQEVDLLPKGDPGTGSTACDTVLTRDGRFAYFANRGNDFLMSFRIDQATGKLTPLGSKPRTTCGGHIPRNFALDPTERWMLVANQGSSNMTVIARNPETGELADKGTNYPAATPMCIVFV